MDSTPRADDVSVLRRFGRVYVRRAGLLKEAPYDPALTLLESRVLFELAAAGASRAKDLAAGLSVDKGRLSRVVSSLRERRLVAERDDPSDARAKRLALTPGGRRLFRRIDRVSAERAGAILKSLPPAMSKDLVEHLRAAEVLLSPERRLRPEDIRLREPRCGDLGWVVSRHGELYHREFGWNEDFERLVAQIVSAFARKHDPARERAWIAEALGLRLGCVFLVRQDRRTAKLRILLVEPMARGLGLGSRLVRECVAFARRAGYRRVVLWTNDVLVSARKIYESEGFSLDREERHRSFGKSLVGQFWSKELR